MTALHTRSDSLRRARAEGSDRYYVQLADVERGLYPFRDHFRGASILLNCDDADSEFWSYFLRNLDFLGIERIVGVRYAGPGERSHAMEATVQGGEARVRRIELDGDGDFRSPEVVQLLDQADVVATAPPSALFSDHVRQAISRGKKVISLGGKSTATYRDVWPLIASGELWLSVHPTGNVVFEIPDDAPSGRWGYREDGDGRRLQTVRNFCWFTNLEIPRRRENIPLYRRYADDPRDFPQYDDHDAIEVSKVAQIPEDYDGEMGVPTTFLEHHNPEQFEIVGLDRYLPGRPEGSRFHLYGREQYARIIIRPATATTERNT